jgi:hypothetical protein
VGEVKSAPPSYPNVMRQGAPQRSLADMANEKINGNRRPDKYADGINAAERPDCLAPNEGGSLLGLLTIPYALGKDKCKLPR